MQPSLSFNVPRSRHDDYCTGLRSFLHQSPSTGNLPPSINVKSPKMASQTLFTLPILNSPTSDKASGTVVCTSPSAGVYVLTFTSPPDNRLLTPFCQTLLLALDILEFSYPHGVVITTSGIQKFFSNGLDLEHASSTKGFFPNSLFALFKRLLTYAILTLLTRIIFSLDANHCSDFKISDANHCIDQRACICRRVHAGNVPRLPSLQPISRLPMLERARTRSTFATSHVLRLPAETHASSLQIDGFGSQEI